MSVDYVTVDRLNLNFRLFDMVPAEVQCNENKIGQVGSLQVPIAIQYLGQYPPDAVRINANIYFKCCCAQKV